MLGYEPEGCPLGVVVTDTADTNSASFAYHQTLKQEKRKHLLGLSHCYFVSLLIAAECNPKCYS